MVGGPGRQRNVESALVGLAAAFCLLLAGVFLRPLVVPTASESSVAEILAAISVRSPAAITLAEEHSARRPDDPFAIALAAEAAASQSEHELAIRHYERLPKDGRGWEFFAELGQGRRHHVQGHVEKAEQHLRRALELDPFDLEANERLGHLLQVQGRTWESVGNFFVQIQRGKCRGDELLGVANTERYFRGDDHLNLVEFLNGTPELPMKLAAARRALYDNRNAEAESLLREVVAARPEIGEAQGRLGRMIVNRGNLDEFLRWRGSLPEEARRHPEVCFAEGLLARRLGQIEGAVRCFLDALTLSPNHLSANVQIAGCLESLGRTEAAREFSRRAENLAELEGTLNMLRMGTDPNLMRKAVSALGRMGRFWEAAGWCLTMSRMEIPREEPRRELRRWLRLALAESGPDAPSALPSRLVDRRDFAVPRWPGQTNSSTGDLKSKEAPVAWNFSDEATKLGILFEYYDGTTDEARLKHIFNTVGGGLGALDYDLDGWPDLYLAQGNNWREPSAGPQNPDRLYRNLAGEQFSDATLQAGTGDPSFSHGVTAGDFNQDGFPDVYVANLGPNRLYWNNGDGTFEDVTGVAGVGGNEWSTSSVFADLNNDGIPDLYVLNYSRLKETREKVCRWSDGEIVACTPDLLLSEYDRCYVNQGDGTFRDVSEESGIRVGDGRGLGVIAWDFAGDGRLGLFVANDTTPNFLFINQGNNSSGAPRFEEQGLVRGVAINAEGTAQASMGVAAGDVTGDGRLDLFITTFFGDTKTLYSQAEGGFFSDVTRPYNLRDAGFWMLGFGCQFADFDGDGWDDLVETNGHVDQKSYRGDPDRMPPQLFRNLGGRKFAEVPAAELGPFFQGRYLGRGLATFDWNRDGRTDFGVSHLHAPFALLTNRTPSSGDPIVIRLIGRTGCREPTGAIVRMKTRTRETVRLVTGGDGYLVTNERRIHFSAPPEERTSEVEVRWPGGNLERWSLEASGREIQLIEGRTKAVVLRTFSAGE